MKVIGITNNCTTQSNTGFPGIYLMADSSLLKDGKPFFVPDFSQEISYSPSLVIRINRLGKNISGKFAPRYYDAVTVGLALKAEDIAESLKSNGEPTDLATGFDGAAILGDFITLERLHYDSYNFNMNLNGTEIFMGSTADLIMSVDETIAFLSKYFTLKIGDIIFMGIGSPIGKIELNQHFRATINNIEVLDFKTK